jgi:hypothetical protein
MKATDKILPQTMRSFTDLVAEATSSLRLALPMQPIRRSLDDLLDAVRKLRGYTRGI